MFQWDDTVFGLQDSMVALMNGGLPSPNDYFTLANQINQWADAMQTMRNFDAMDGFMAWNEWFLVNVKGCDQTTIETIATNGSRWQWGQIANAVSTAGQVFQLGYCPPNGNPQDCAPPNFCQSLKNIETALGVYGVLMTIMAASPPSPASPLWGTIATIAGIATVVVNTIERFAC
jgi:hypothetical protein